MNRVVQGVVAGVVGTGLMSIVMAGGRAAGLMYTSPPEQITGTAEQKSGIGDHLSKPTFTLSWLGAHVAYGAACGVLYALGRRWLPTSTPLAGLLFGEAVWGASYLGLMPQLGLYPRPEADSPRRMAVMIAAHAVFGMGTAEATRRLQGDQHRV